MKYEYKCPYKYGSNRERYFKGFRDALNMILVMLLHDEDNITEKIEEIIKDIDKEC